MNVDIVTFVNEGVGRSSFPDFAVDA